LDPQSQVGYQENEEGIPVYIEDEIAALVEHATDPLTPVQVLTYVVEPKLFQAAEDGHLFNVRTSEISWIKWDSLSALTEAEVAQVMDQTASAQAEGEAEADEIRQWIRQQAAEAEDPAAFVDRIATLAVDVQPDVDMEHLMDSCSLPTLRHIKQRLAPAQAARPVL
jgi:hypothetical protein